MARSSGTDKLVCQHGYFRWADFQLCRMESGGYGLVVPCEWGDHWLVPDPEQAGRHIVRLEAFTWPSGTAALGARDAWRRQQEAQ